MKRTDMLSKRDYEAQMAATRDKRMKWWRNARFDMLFYFACLLLAPFYVPAADWAQYRGDAARSGYTTEPLPADLALVWVRKAQHGPQCAWPRPDSRMAFDRAFYPVASHDTVFIGSSADCSVYAIDAQTGKERWRFVTGSPVRFAPVLWKQRLFVVSDDGYLYCLSAKDGNELWKKRAGPRDDMVLGNGRMVSRWLARGGPVISDGTLYFGAGIWTAEGVYLYALDPMTGKIKWVNNTLGAMTIEHPHGGNKARSGVSIQGYLAADDKRLYVPTGRSVPAVFDRATGKLLYFHLAKVQKGGGSRVQAGSNFFIGAGAFYDPGKGGGLKGYPRTSSSATVILPDGMASWSEGKVVGYRLVTVDTRDRKGKSVKSTRPKAAWSLAMSQGGSDLLVAGKTVVSAGATGVAVRTIGSEKPEWTVKTDGAVYGLAFAGGRLFAATEKGTLYCFAKPTPETPNKAVIEPDIKEPAIKDVYTQAAGEILKKSGIKSGYCIDLGCGDGSLALALAKRTDLRIYAIDKDPRNVALARRRLFAAGLYGVRVTVHQGDPKKTPYPGTIANLVVSGRSVTGGPSAVIRKEVMRVLRPGGGVACLGKPDAMERIVRKPLPGAGVWTHQYADAASTSCSNDDIIRAPLGMLWFTDFGLQMPNRHGRGPAPLYKDGMMVVVGVDGLLGVDAYNGRVVWRYGIPGLLKRFDQEHLVGTAGTHGMMCIGGSDLFVRYGETCLTIDLQTGKKKRAFGLPGGGTWGYISFLNGTLYATRSDTKAIPRYLFGRSKMDQILTQSSTLFALDPETGKAKWAYEATESIRHNAITMDKDRVYLIDQTIIVGDLAKRRGKQPPIKSKLMALDAKTGKPAWESDADIYGTMLTMSAKHNVLLMGYQFSQRKFQFKSEKGNRLTGFRASSGKRIWDASTKKAYLSRLLINGRTIYAQPHAWDLLTGKPKSGYAMKGRQPGGCGTISGSTHLFLYRSGPLGYFDLTQQSKGSQTYGPARPGCWINAIPAGGLVLMPDASDRCRCSYSVKASFALQTMR